MHSIDEVYLTLLALNCTQFSLFILASYKISILPSVLSSRTYLAGFGWDPCAGIMCGSSSGISAGCAVCMSIPDSPGVCCGNTSHAVWIWETSKMKLGSELDKFPDWQVEYTHGVAWR